MNYCYCRQNLNCRFNLTQSLMGYDFKVYTVGRVPSECTLTFWEPLARRSKEVSAMTTLGIDIVTVRLALHYSNQLSVNLTRSWQTFSGTVLLQINAGLHVLVVKNNTFYYVYNNNFCYVFRKCVNNTSGILVTTYMTWQRSYGAERSISELYDSKLNYLNWFNSN